MNAPQGRAILRYSAGTRINHWIVAISFVLLALVGARALSSGALLADEPVRRRTLDADPASLHRRLHGRGVCPLGRELWRENYLQQRDWIWLRKIRDVVNNHEENLPEVGRYNGGQKLLFFTIVACLIGLLLTGIVIWRSYFSAFFPIRVLRYASLLHAFCGFVLICAIIVHIYAGIWVKGSIRAMTRGWVTPGWAWKHHRAWFREVTKGVPQK